MSKQKGRTPRRPADYPPRRLGPESHGVDPWPATHPPPVPAPADPTAAAASPERDAELKRQIQLGISRAFAEAAELQRRANPPGGFYGGDTGIVGLGPLASFVRFLPKLSRAAVVGKGVAPAVAERAAQQAHELADAVASARGRAAAGRGSPVVVEEPVAEGSLIRRGATEGAIRLRKEAAARLAARSAHEAEVARQPLLHSATVRGGLAILGVAGAAAAATWAGSAVNDELKRYVDKFEGGMRGPGPTPESRIPRLRLDPNTAPREVLGALPGVGPKMADAIVAARKRRPFDSAKDFDARVSGIGPATMQRLRPNLRFPGDGEPAAGGGSGVVGDDVAAPVGPVRGSPPRPAVIGVPGRAPQADRVWDDVLRGRSPRMIGPVGPDSRGGVGPGDLRLPPVGKAIGEERLLPGVDPSEIHGERPGAFVPRPASSSVLDLVRGASFRPGAMQASQPIGAPPAASAAGSVAATKLAVDGSVGSLDRLARAAESAAAALEAVRRPPVRSVTGALVAPPPRSDGRM